jgi:hypothetical protein
MSTTPIGTLKIHYVLDEDGDILTGVEVEGEIPVVVQLGLLEMAKDTILNPPDDDDDDY